MDLMNKLVKHVLNTRYEDLPEQAVEAARKATIDTLGCLIAGSTGPGCAQLANLAKEYGGKQEATVMIYGGKVPAISATLVNVTMARALDFDDVHMGENSPTKTFGGHINATFIPVSLNLAEYSKKAISGKDFILAYTLGADLSIRLGTARKVSGGWHGEVFAPFGVVATGGKLLGFDEERMANGMGIAYTQCSGTSQGYEEGVMMVPVQQGLGAKAGVLAIMLAERGFTGVRNVLEGTCGLYPVYMRNEYDPIAVTQELGKQFETVNTSLKPYPSGKGTHIPIVAIIEMMKEHMIKPVDIDEIIVNTSKFVYEACGKGDIKYRPRTVIDAHFSVPYAVSTAAIKGRFCLEDLTEEEIKNQDVLDLAQRVKVKIDPEMDKISIIPPNNVEIRTKNGQFYSKYVEYVKGQPQCPMTMGECIEKFRGCVPFSARSLPEANINKVIELVERLEELEDVTDIIRLLKMRNL